MVNWFKDEKEYVVGGKKFKTKSAAIKHAKKTGKDRIRVDTFGFTFFR